MVIMIEVLWALKVDVITNLKSLYNNRSIRVKGITQLVECSFNTHKALDSIPSTSDTRSGGVHMHFQY